MTSWEFSSCTLSMRKIDQPKITPIDNHRAVGARQDQVRAVTGVLRKEKKIAAWYDERATIGCGFDNRWLRIRGR